MSGRHAKIGNNSIVHPILAPKSATVNKRLKSAKKSEISKKRLKVTQSCVHGLRVFASILSGKTLLCAQ